MPTVLLAKGVGSWIGVLMMVSVFCMIYSTGVGMFFAFAARFAMPNTKKFRLIGLASCLVGLLLSFAGFTKLVGTVYPLLGYLGLALIAAVLVYWLRNRGKSSKPRPPIAAGCRAGASGQTLRPSPRPPPTA
jgi:uncharacterized membrane protein YkvI